MTDLNFVCILLLSTLLMNSGNSQVIKTYVGNDDWKSWSYGNSNEVNMQGRDNLYGMLPPLNDYPFILDIQKAEFIHKLDSIFDSYFISDFANIDSKDFNPQDRNFFMAFQRRVDPFVLLCK